MPFEWGHVGCEIEIMDYQRLKSMNHSYKGGVIGASIGRSALQKCYLSKCVTMKDDKDNVLLVVQTEPLRRLGGVQKI